MRNVTVNKVHVRFRLLSKFGGAISLREHNRPILVCPSRLPRKITVCWVLRGLSYLPFRTSFTARIPRIIIAMTLQVAIPRGVLHASD